MKEDFLHFLWKHQKFPLNNLTTTQGSSLQVVNQGVYNTHAGPDFSDARLKIDLLDWIGHVEIHIKSSDWFAHQHQQDSNYDAVILHVVWEIVCFNPRSLFSFYPKRKSVQNGLAC